MAYLRRLWSILGPGLLLAGAAVGVSHLVQATRAGADYGFALWWVLLFAVLTKYPFLEFGPRYAAATGETLLHGYRRLGPWPFRIFIFITVGTMFVIQAAVTIVTAGLAEQVFQLGLSPLIWCLILLSTCVFLLLLGRYRALDQVMKVIVSLLALATLVAVVLAFSTTAPTEVTDPPDYWNAAGLAFIIALIGWLPIPLDASVWHSIWHRTRDHQSDHPTTLAEARTGFNIGYFVAAALGFLFFFLGALIMFGSGQEFAGDSVQFSAQLAGLYAVALGDWSRSFVLIAALCAMFSTTLAVSDAFPRVLSHIWLHTEASDLEEPPPRIYNMGLFAVPFGALIILTQLADAFTTLVDFAAALSFLSAPFLAYFNYRLITAPHVPSEARPSRPYAIFSLICLASLSLFAAAYLLWLFVAP